MTKCETCLGLPRMEVVPLSHNVYCGQAYRDVPVSVQIRDNFKGHGATLSFSFRNNFVEITVSTNKKEAILRTASTWA